MQRIPMTVSGEKQLKDELDKLKFEVRPKVVEAIAEARAHGDLKENAEYHAAREQQGFVEGRIRDIEFKLANAQIIDIAKLPSSDKVVFGSTITLLNCETDEEKVYQIVGEDEADLKLSKISVSSPIARALIGKFEGDVVEVTTPGGVTEYEISEVKYL
ncbi:transcription elongation factor GreA [Thiotrichales bacterium 19S3-7]|nr:transcription elongation factor GreA [Thiotrichales bacterium 19S3-7]MCF6803066.1 transcription elongation factor GreA [Thiotrichales bacterium 19S3-11]